MSLKQLSVILTKIHLQILEGEKVVIGQLLQRTPTPYDLLSVLSSDPRFSWLKPLTQLIAYVDEVAEQPETSQIRDQIKIRIQEVLLSETNRSESVAQTPTHLIKPDSPTVGEKYLNLRNTRPEILDLHISLMKFMSQNDRKPSDSLN